MAQIIDGNSSVAGTPKARRRKARGRQGATSRSGAGAGLGTIQRPAPVNPGGLTTLTTEQAYQLGMRHGCELGGVAWPTLTKR